jgi:hypothetical protein
LGRHLETFRKLEGMQAQALEGMKTQGMEGLAALMAGQQEVLLAIAREKAELKPHLDRWEMLRPDERARLREGKAGEILDALEAVAQSIAARHKDWFGDDGSLAQEPSKDAGAGKKDEQPPQDLSQTINMYRGLK